MVAEPEVARPQRPALRYHGSKFRLAAWIISHLPPHHTYVEPYSGGASILLQKAPSPVECLNDLSGRVVRRLMLVKRVLVSLSLLAALLGAPAPVVHSTTYSEFSVRWWATAYNLDPDRLWQMALCESSGSPDAYNPSGAYGLLQFMPATYNSLRAALNADPTLAPHLSAFDPEWRGMAADDGAAEAHVAAWSIHAGYGDLWACRY